MSIIGNLVGSPVGSVIRQSLFGVPSTGATLALDALTYDPTTFEALGVKTGVGGLTNARADARYVQDHEGVYHLIAATEPAWHGARHVDNFLQRSEDFGNAYWAKVDVSAEESTVTPPGNTGTCWRVTDVSGGFLGRGSVASIRESAIKSVYARTVTGTGTVGIATHSSNGLVSLTEEWQRISFAAAEESVFSNAFYVVDFRAGTLNEVLVTGAMMEEAAGRSDITTPSEYILTTTSAVQKSFWNENGNSVASNIVTETAGALLSPLPMLDHTPAATNSQIKSNDLADAEWNATNVTVGDQDAAGVTGMPNTACTLTASAGNGTVIANAITAGADNHATKWYLQRSVGTGVVELTVDGGSTWQAITSALDGDFAPGIVVDQAAVTNPQIGIRIVTSGDAVIVGNAECHLDSSIAILRNASPIITTTVAVSQSADTGTLDAANHNNDEVCYYMEWSPGYDYDEKLIPIPILDIRGVTPGLLYDPTIAGRLTSDDGTNAARLSGLTYSNGDIIKIGVRASISDNKMALVIDGVSTSEKAYKGYLFSTDINLISKFYPARLRTLQRWDITGATAQKAKIDDLMT